MQMLAKMKNWFQDLMALSRLFLVMDFFYDALSYTLKFWSPFGTGIRTASLFYLIFLKSNWICNILNSCIFNDVSATRDKKLWLRFYRRVGLKTRIFLIIQTQWWSILRSKVKDQDFLIRVDVLPFVKQFYIEVFHI